MNILERIEHYRVDATYIGLKTRPEWSGSLPFYRFFCSKHGEVENYPHGYAEILRCPKCDAEDLERRRTLSEATKRTKESSE